MNQRRAPRSPPLRRVPRFHRLRPGDVRDEGSEVFQFERGIRCHEKRTCLEEMVSPCRGTRKPVDVNAPSRLLCSHNRHVPAHLLASGSRQSAASEMPRLPSWRPLMRRQCLCSRSAVRTKGLINTVVCQRKGDQWSLFLFRLHFVLSVPSFCLLFFFFFWLTLDVTRSVVAR